MSLARGPRSRASVRGQGGTLRAGEPQAGVAGPRARLTALLIIVLASWAFASAAAQQKVPLVFDHLVVVIDEATWHDVDASAFLRTQFAGPHSVLTDGVTLRLMGKHNYIVFVSPPHLRLNGDPNPVAPVGNVSIVLGAGFRGNLNQLSRDTDLTPIQATEPGDWFRTVSLAVGANKRMLSRVDSVSAERFSIIQYTAGSMRRMAETDTMPVADFAGYYRLPHGYDSTRLVRDLTGATVAIPVDDIAKIKRVLERDGVTVFAEGEGAIIKLDGFTLHLIPPWSGAGVKQLQFALTRGAVANPIYTFGPRSRLRFGPGPIAVWDFNTR